MNKEKCVFHAPSLLIDLQDYNDQGDLELCKSAIKCFSVSGPSHDLSSTLRPQHARDVPRPSNFCCSTDSTVVFICLDTFADL